MLQLRFESFDGWAVDSVWAQAEAASIEHAAQIPANFKNALVINYNSFGPFSFSKQTDTSTARFWDK